MKVKSQRFIKDTGHCYHGVRMILTYKTQIYPSEIQLPVLWDLSELCRLLYNFALTERKVIWEQERHNPYRRYHALLNVDAEGHLLDSEFELMGAKTQITYQDQQNALPDLKTRYPHYQWVYSKLLQMVLKTLDADFKSFFALWKTGDTQARPPKYKGKKYFTTLKYNQSGFKVEEGMLKLSHKHPSGVELRFRLPYVPAGQVKQVELYLDRVSHKWFVAFNCYLEPLKYFDNGLYQAFDPGIDNIVAAVNSQGKYLKIKNRRPDLYWKKKIAEVQSKRDHCRKFSRNWHWYHLKLVKMIRKLANQLLDFQHWLSNRIVRSTKANTLIFGKPTIKKMAKRQKGPSKSKPRQVNTSHKSAKTLHYSLQNTGTIARFIELVTYKAQRAGKLVIPIDEFLTTRICPPCGYIEYRPLSERIIVCCNCGYTEDRDLASSVNLMAKFYIQKPRLSTNDYRLLHEPSVNEESFFQRWKGFLRQTAEGKTKVSLADFWLRFGGLAGKEISPTALTSVEVAGLVKTTFKMIEAPSFR